MNEIKIVINNKPLLFHAPSSWDEFTPKQMLTVVKTLPYFLSGENCDDMLMELLCMAEKKFRLLSAMQKYHIVSLFDFLLKEPVIKKLIIESFKHKGIQYIGYQSGFGNITWEEFITAERYFMRNDYTIAAAVLYRQKRAKHAGETDPRVPFSIYGTDKRAELFKTLDPCLLASIALNYSCLRKIYITNKYKYVFTSAASKEKSYFSWISITRSVLGEDFFEEKKILKSNVHTVLHRLNTLLDPTNKKKGKK